MIRLLFLTFINTTSTPSCVETGELKDKDWGRGFGIKIVFIETEIDEGGQV